MTLTRQVFGALADGEFHSGEALAAHGGVTRSAVWKAIEQLRELGLLIEAQTNKGYRLAEPCEPLDAERITAALPKEISRHCSARIEWELVSTNATLLAESAPPPHSYSVLLAENQTGGRGRRGRAWRAALGGSLCISLATSFEPLPRDLPALTLVIGVCVRAALTERGARSLQLKWPNDLVRIRRETNDEMGLEKQGGILVELRAEAGGPGHVVVGIGLNLRLDAAAREAIAASGNIAGDLQSIGVDVAARNLLAAAIIEHSIVGLERFRTHGFAPFRDLWQVADALRDQPVRIIEVAGDREGIARGIDAQGALQIDCADGTRIALQSGEVSVRGKSS